MSDGLADDSKDVLEKVKADGTFDEMRLRVTEAVKKSVGHALIAAGYCIVVLPGLPDRVLL